MGPNSIHTTRNHEDLMFSNFGSLPRMVRLFAKDE